MTTTKPSYLVTSYKSMWICSGCCHGLHSHTFILTGVRAPSGGIREEGETAVIGYFQQHPPEVDDNLRLIDYIRCERP